MKNLIQIWAERPKRVIEDLNEEAEWIGKCLQALKSAMPEIEKASQATAPEPHGVSIESEASEGVKTSEIAPEPFTEADTTGGEAIPPILTGDEGGQVALVTLPATPAPKMTPAERMAKARAARKAKVQ